jgi:shikimate dehydrogenase
MSVRRSPSVLVGLIGDGIQASLTPAMHEREGEAQGFRYLYQLIDLDMLGLDARALPELLTAAQRMGFAGLNITHPYKQAVIPLLDTLSNDARALGAVNTVVLHGGKRVGHNTDWSGFAESFRRGLPDAALGRVVQFGAGGAGAAVAHAAVTLGVKHLTIIDTDSSRAASVAKRLCTQAGRAVAVAGQDTEAAVAAADGVINATPLGMAKYPGMPLPAALLRPALWVADVVYFPLRTELLQTADALGCRTLHGGGMAVFQAVEAFRLFTGKTADAGRMQRHFADMIART